MTTVTYSYEGGTNGSNVAAGSGAAAGDTNFDAIFNTSATNIYDNTRAAHGTLSNEIATSATSTSSYVSWTTSIGTQTTVWVRAYLFFTAAPTVQHRVVNFVGSASSRGNVLATTAGKLIFTNAAGGTVLTSLAFPTGAWFRLEAMFTGSATVGQWEYKIWNTPDSSGAPDDTQTSAANLNTGGTVDTYRFGIGSAVANAGPFWQDDVGVSTTAYIGPVTSTDPLTLAWGAAGNYWHLYNRAAGAIDRREVPAQRAYISVPGAVDAPANPLLPPLDTAWQAGAAYWHLYNDSALRDRRAYFQQRPLVSDPNLLQPAGNADPLALNPEQSDSSDLWRAAIVPAFYDRREVPQQRAYYDLSLLATAQLENELLGGGDTARHWLPACFTDRREVPQQRAYISDPSFYPADAEVGAGTTEAWWGADTDGFYRQRPYVSDPSFYSPQNNLDTLLTGQGLLDGHQHQAATHADRREVPQQRLYISDPSFYPAVAPVDPLTLAWGAGGNYWHLYGDSALRDRREVPQQRAYFAAIDLPLDPVLAAFADLARRYGLPFTHYDRREVPQQRVYFPVPPPPPALQDATSSPMVSAPDTSLAAVTGSGSTSLVTAAASSAPAVSDG